MLSQVDTVAHLAPAWDTNRPAQVHSLTRAVSDVPQKISG